jgi:hypothetical protein
MHRNNSNDMHHKSNVQSIFKRFSECIPLVRKDVSNREIQVDLLCSSLLFLTSIVVIVFFHCGSSVTV